MQDEQRTRSQQFDLLRFVSNSLRFLRSTFWLVLAAGVLGALLMGIYAAKTYSPHYESHAVLSVRVDNSTVTDVIGSGDKNNSTYTKQLVSTFPTIIQSDSMRDRIMRELGTDRINGTILPRVVAESSLFTLTVRSSNPEDAYNILNAVIKCYPEMAFVYIGAATITLIEAPAVPAAPVNALNVKRSAAIGGLAGALLMLAVLCLLAQLQTVVTSSSDLQRYTNVPCIVHVPQTELKRRTRGGNVLSLRNEHLPPVYEESIRVLSARVLRQCREQGLRRIIITSTVPGEGKSTIAANLALSLSRSGLRIVLIDADLRTQELREFFGIEGEPLGLRELLQDQSLNPLECLTPVPDTNVQLLCGGRIDKPVSLLRHSRLGPLLEAVDKAADLVLIDTPPIGLLTDAAAFAQYSDAGIYVVRAGATAGNRIADGMQSVADCRTKILGYVLNGVSAKAGSHGYGYRYSYGYGYGSRYGSGYGSSYGSYGGYDSYGGYGGYADYSDDSASTVQKKAESGRKQETAAEPAASGQSKRRAESESGASGRRSGRETERSRRQTESRSARTETRESGSARTETRESRSARTETRKSGSARTETRKSGSARTEARESAPARTEAPRPQAEAEPVRAAAAEAPRPQAEAEPVRAAAAEAPRPQAEAGPVRAPAAEAPRPQAEAGPVRAPAAEAPAPAAAPKASSYDDPELDAIVREVLASTTEEDVRKAYETLEAEQKAAAEAKEPSRAKQKKHSRRDHE